MTNLEMLKALEAAATPGPWTFHGWTGDVGAWAKNVELAVALRNAFPALLRELEAARKVIEAANALAHPDGIIRGPLTDGPELDALNAALNPIPKG